ncbi:MAG: M14 family metallocarboxypeptidase [Oscillospiraceae bacterium]|nr:M14 family metallocarboxypeptidase [Oscillospiraceae bacterium]
MAIVKTDVPQTSEMCNQTIMELVKKYPFLRSELLTETAFGRKIRTLVIGKGKRKVIYSAAHHANEWITTPILLKFAEEFAQAIQNGTTIFGIDAKMLADTATIYMVPMVDPDGVDLVTGAIRPGEGQYETAARLAENYPGIPFPEGWKANLLGVDLNLQYPAGWLRAREIKFLQGYTRPGPRDFVGRSPLDQKESRALAGYTEYIDPDLILAYHAQGKEIYWQFDDIEIPGAEELGQQLAAVSGYTLTEPAEVSSYAGYKDWFIKTFRRPGYTIEVGSGMNPLPLEQFEEIYRDNLGILVTAAIG